MNIRRCLTVVVLSVGLSSSLASALTVNGSPGGLVARFAAEEQGLEARGEGVRINGGCASACTIYLHNPKVCVTPHARFMFHSAFIPVDPEHGDFRRASDDLEATAYIWSMYPTGVQAFIAARGGLSATPIFMNYSQALHAGIPACR